VIEYPKIDTLYDRDPKTFKVIPGRLRRPEFGMIRDWIITEKIDGTNVRVHWTRPAKSGDGIVTFWGRTDAAQMPVTLVNYLLEKFAPERFSAVFPEDKDAVTRVTLYGEGYGPKIQKAGGLYRPDLGFRLFDVRVGEWWLEWDSVCDVADKMGIKTVPVLSIAHLGSVENCVRMLKSVVAYNESDSPNRDGVHAEGIVARSSTTLFNRKGQRVMWKLKAKDLAPAVTLVAS
jgi:hypothetical protein